MINSFKEVYKYITGVKKEDCLWVNQFKENSLSTNIAYESIFSNVLEDFFGVLLGKRLYPGKQTPDRQIGLDHQGNTG